MLEKRLEIAGVDDLSSDLSDSLPELKLHDLSR